MAVLGLGIRLRENCMIGIGIGRYKPSGLRDCENLSRDAGSKNFVFPYILL